MIALVDWPTIDEARARLTALGAPPQTLEIWTTTGSLTLGRAIQTKMENGARRCHPGDLEAAIGTGNVGGDGRYLTFPDGIDDASGKRWRTTKWARAELRFARTSVIRWHKHKTHLLKDKNLKSKKLPGRKIPVYAGDGKWLAVWVFRESQLRRIRAVIDDGGIIDPKRGPGWSYAECAEEGFGRDWLNRASRKKDKDGKRGKGIFELKGEILKTWFEYRISAHGHITAFRVFSPSQLRRTMGARAKITDGKADEEGISDQDAMKRWPNQIHAGDLPQWRIWCQWINKHLHHWYVKTRWGTPKNEKGEEVGEIRNSLSELELIVKAIGESQEKPYTDPTTGRTFTLIALTAFAELTSMVEQEIAYYRTHAYTPLGRPIDFTKDEWKGRRNAWKENYLYSREDGAAVKAWREAKADKPNACARFLLELLDKGSLRAQDVKRLARTKGFVDDTFMKGKNLAEIQDDRKEPGTNFRLYYRKDRDPMIIQSPPPVAEVGTMASAARETENVSVSVMAPHPIHLASVDDHVVQQFATAFQGARTPVPDPIPDNCIIALGGRNYRIADHRPRMVTESEDAVLQAFLGLPAMDLAELDDKTGLGQDMARMTLARLKTKYERHFAPAIDLPEVKGQGGYHVRIQRAP